MGQNNKREQSEFNSALAYLERLHISQIIISQARRELNTYTWYMELWNMFSELTPFMNDKEINDTIKALEKINEEIQQNQKHNQLNPKIKPQIFKELMRIEIKFKIIIKTSGLLTKMKAEADNAIEEM